MTFKKPTPAAVEGVNFGSLDFYVAGGGLPEGDYALEFNVEMFQATDNLGNNRGPARLGVQVTAYSLNDTTADPRKQFYSMGSNADKSFAPNPETGKGLVAVPNAPAATLPQNTNWAIFLKSLYDCGLPEGVLTNDFSVLDGIHAHVASVPEPEERKGYKGSSTAEAQQAERKPGFIAIIAEIKDDGKPWEGTGGIPDGTAAPAPTKPGPRAVPARVPAKAPVKAPVKPAAAVADESDLQTEAINAFSAVLETSPVGMAKLKMRTMVFKQAGQEVGQAIIETYFADDDALNSVLSVLGYVSAGGQIKPA